MDPARIYAMADSNNTQNVPWENIFKSLQKIVSHITPEFVSEAYTALEVTKSDRITKDDFVSMLGRGGSKGLLASPGKAK
jgi:hypothetical protein